MDIARDPVACELASPKKLTQGLTPPRFGWSVSDAGWFKLGALP
jgi:hypothetical protein